MDAIRRLRVPRDLPARRPLQRSPDTEPGGETSVRQILDQ